MDGNNTIRKSEKELQTNDIPVIQRPERLRPWAELSESTDRKWVWIHMRARPILNQFSKQDRTSKSISVGKPTKEFKFLAPLNINENIVHQWEPYESIASRLAQKARSLVKLTSEVTSLFERNANLAQATKDTYDRIAQGKTGNAVETAAKALYQRAGNARIPKIKVDTPLYYQNSERRQLVFDFQLYHEGLNRTDPTLDLVKPIQDLMKLSSPSLISDITIDFPYMFQVYTTPQNFIRYSNCALVGVQPTWKSPYIDGVPTSCDLQLTFLDMSPLYRETIEKGTVINVKQTTDTDARQSRGQSPVTNQFAINNRNQ